MDEPDESAAYETFQNVIRDLVQPLVGDVKGALNSTLEKQLHDPKGQLAEQGEILEEQGKTLAGVVLTLAKQATRSDEMSANLDKIQTANTEIASSLQGLDAAVPRIKADMSLANANLAQQIQELQSQHRAIAAVQESDSRRTFRLLLLAVSLGVLNAGLLVWMIAYT